MKNWKDWVAVNTPEEGVGGAATATVTGYERQVFILEPLQTANIGDFWLVESADDCGIYIVRREDIKDIYIFCGDL